MEIKSSLHSFSSGNKNPKNKIKNNNKKKVQIMKCCINFFRNVSSKGKELNSKCPIIFQFFLVIFPISIAIYLIVMVICLYLFYSKFKLDYYTLIKEEYLKYLITDIDDIRFDLRLNEIKTHFDDKGDGLFFKFYLEELISLGLLDEDEVKIFPNISNLTNASYKFLEEKENNNSIYSIPLNISKKYIDERNDSFSELAKIYFHFYPLLSIQGIMIDSHINQSYLIAYEIDNNSNILGDELYFNFPRLNRENIKDNIFCASSNLKSPKICRQNQTYELINNSYYEGNFFTIQDYEFRKASSEENNLIINAWHLNDVSKENISKSFIESLQMYFNKNEKKYIINIIYYNPQEKIVKNFFDYTVLFINRRNSLNNCLKYSDNTSFVISKNDITELVLSTLPNDYFHFGIKDIDNNFYRHGIFFDSFDVERLPEFTKYYSTLKGFTFDLMYFSSFYLYTKLFEKSSYKTSFSTAHNIKVFLFDDKETIQDICSKFDFNMYKKYLKENDLNCLDESNLYYYSYKIEEKESMIELVPLPLCICLPLYCIQDVQDIFERSSFLFVDQLLLPEKCQNKIIFYDNIYKETEDDETNVKEKGYSQYLSELYLESQHIQFGIKNFELYNDLFYTIICIFDNKSIKKILTQLINDIDNINYIFAYLTMSIIALTFILSYIFLLSGTKRIANIVYGYKEKFLQFIINYEKNVVSDAQSNDISEISKYDKFLSGSKKEDIIPYIKYEDLISEEINKNKKSNNCYENGLINDLFVIYCNYKRTSEEKIFNNNFVYKNKSKTKYEILNDSNELLKMFCVMSIHLPKFISNVNFNYDFYKEAKLSNNYLKLMRRLSFNKYKEELISTKSIIYEFLSTEMVIDYGLITNINFEYIIAGNLDSKDKNNCVQNGIFNLILKKEIIDFDLYEEEELNINKSYHDNEFNTKFVLKNRNPIIERIEEKFEQDDYLKLNKLDSSFNFFLIDTCFNYMKRIESEKKL